MVAVVHSAGRGRRHFARGGGLRGGPLRHQLLLLLLPRLHDEVIGHDREGDGHDGEEDDGGDQQAILARRKDALRRVGGVNEGSDRDPHKVVRKKDNVQHARNVAVHDIIDHPLLCVCVCVMLKTVLRNVLICMCVSVICK